MPKTLFLDTNIYLHYQDIEQIDWLRVVKAEAVVIVVPPITVQELNKHKYAHPRTRVRERAATIVKKLSALFESSLLAQLNSGVAIRLEDRDPLIDFQAYHLSRESQDDNLIASIIMERDEVPGTEVILATSDAGLTLMAKARRHGITPVRLPDTLKLPDEPDPEQKRMRELERQLAELRASAPQLSLTFRDGSDHATFVLPRPIELTPIEVEQRVTELRRRYPKRSEQLKGASESRRTDRTLEELLAAVDTSPLNVVSPADIAEYNAELDKFYQVYADEYLQREVSYKNLEYRTVRLDIGLSNDGNAPAEDVDVFMHFPDALRLRGEDDFPEPPAPPEPPPGPKSILDKLAGSLAGLGSAHFWPSVTSAPVLPPPNVSRPNIRHTSSYDVDVQVQRLKHGLREPFDVFFVTFESFDAAFSFHIDYEILAGNLPNKVSGQLHVIIQKEE